MAEGVGFEPTCLTANGFQDRLVMTTSITLPMKILFIIPIIGGAVKVKISLDGNRGTRLIAVTVGYDANIYTYDGFTSGITSEAGSVYWIQPEGPEDYDTNETTGLTWITISGIVTSLDGWHGTEIMTVNFRVRDDVESSITKIYANVDEQGAVGMNDKFFPVKGAEVEIEVDDLLHGDFNKDKRVNMVDVVQMLRYYVYRENAFENLDEKFDLAAFDANQDGIEDLNDVLFIMAKVNDRQNKQAAGK